jgi:phospholipid/cholesterol/gamma-HCH transport system ATP-binding protein
MIRIVDLYKSFGPLHILRGVNLTIQDGHTTTVLGLSGSGKSTILKHIIGLMRPTSGQIFVKDTEISRLRGADLDTVRRKFGVVFQHAALLQSLTVFENVALPLREHRNYSRSEIEDRVAQKIRTVRLAETDWHKLPSELSGGMRKRVGLARAIVEDPDYILWDEPTTGLDPITNNMVHDMIIESRDELGVTSMVISHDIPGTLRVSDCIAVLYRGQIIEEGSPDQIEHSDNPIVQQLITGAPSGPITEQEAAYRPPEPQKESEDDAASEPPQDSHPQTPDSASPEQDEEDGDHAP